MPYRIEWYWENKVLLQRAWGAWGACTLEAVHGMSHDAIVYFASVEDEAHAIVELTEVVSYPMRLADLRSAVKAPANKRLGWLIFVSKNRLVIFMAGRLRKHLHPHLRSRWVRSFDEALVFLESKIGAIPRNSRAITPESAKSEI